MDFCVEYFCCGSRDVFRMFLNILIFGPNFRFWKVYIAHALSQIFQILEHLLFFEYEAFLEWTNANPAF